MAIQSILLTIEQFSKIEYWIVGSHYKKTLPYALVPAVTALYM